jgi:shikimate kinase
MIVLLGYMGSGKTSVSQYLQNHFGLSYCDLDEYIERQEEKSISEIFKQKGEIYFRKIENIYLNEVLVQKTTQILSFGGGTPCYANNMDVLKKNNANSIYLKVNLDTLSSRLFKNRSDRPLISDIKSEEVLKDFIRKHLFEREYYYRQARHTINVTGLKINEIADKIMDMT